MLESKVSRPFDSSIIKTSELVEDIEPKRLNSVEDMQNLINH